MEADGGSRSYRFAANFVPYPGKETGDKAAATTAYTAAVSVIDRIADKGLIHKNKAARHKSRLNAKIKAFRAQHRGVTDVNFFLFRLSKLYA